MVSVNVPDSLRTCRYFVVTSTKRWRHRLTPVTAWRMAWCRSRLQQQVHACLLAVTNANVMMTWRRLALLADSRELCCASVNLTRSVGIHRWNECALCYNVRRHHVYDNTAKTCAMRLYSECELPACDDWSVWLHIRYTGCVMTSWACCALQQQLTGAIRKRFSDIPIAFPSMYSVLR